MPWIGDNLTAPRGGRNERGTGIANWLERLAAAEDSKLRRRTGKQLTVKNAERVIGRAIAASPVEASRDAADTAAQDRHVAAVAHERGVVQIADLESEAAAIDVALRRRDEQVVVAVDV